MKQPYLLLIALLPLSVLAQNSSVQMKGDFADMAKFGRLQGAESLPTYSSGEVKGTRYLFENWLPGSVTTTSGEVMDKVYVFTFDKQNNDLYVKEKNGFTIILVDKSKVKKFTIEGKHTFIEGAQVPGAEPDKFYEVLGGNDESFVFYKLITTKFIKANRQDAERIKSGDFNDEFRDNLSYYVKSPGQALMKIKLTEGSISKALPGYKSKISQYFSDHSSDDIDEQFIKLLAASLNY